MAADSVEADDSFQFNRGLALLEDCYVLPILKREREIPRSRERERERGLSPADLIRNAAKFLREFWRGGQLAVPRG